MRVHRVERSEESLSAGPFEFPALVGIEDENLSVGAQTSGKDITFPLKTAFLYLAGITREKALRPLPGEYVLFSTCTTSLTLVSGSRRLLRAVAAARISVEQIRQVAREHLRVLRNAAVSFAEDAHFTITNLVISYPNYLCHYERWRDFDKYIDLYRELMQEVWPEIESDSIETISEGQAAAVYIARVFDDPAFSADVKGRQSMFRSLRSPNGTNVIVADFGSSSLNLQVQHIYYGEEGRLVGIQSSHDRGWLLGRKGGSNCSNDKVRQLVEKEFRPLIAKGHVGPGEIAGFVENFEKQKYALDYATAIRTGRDIIIHGIKESFALEPHKLKDIFRTFDRGLFALEKQIDICMEMGTNFAVLLLGGSFNNPGVRQKVKNMMKRKIEHGRKAKKIEIKYEFLRDSTRDRREQYQ